MNLLSLVLVLLGCLQSFGAADFQVDALYEMRLQLSDNRGVLKDWKDNQISPCYWVNVNCQGNNVISITLSSSGLSGFLSPSIAKLTTLQQLLLDGNSITGDIPEEFGNLSSLTTLKLGQNHLNGSIPGSLGHLANLQNLDLSKNHLSGNIPRSLLNLPLLNDINLADNNLTGEIPKQLLQVAQYNFTGNYLNCGHNLFSCDGGSTRAGGSRNTKLNVILGSIGGVVTLLVIVVLFRLWWQRMHYRPEIYIDVSSENDHRLEFRQIKRFSWRELQTATDNFSEQYVIGRGGSGTVYKGILPGPHSATVAVKRLLKVESPEEVEMAFLREVELISIALHKNILRLIGFCTTPTERLLVYPFMENLCVASRLRDIKLNEPVLDWPTRMQIALGAARGLEYLHEHCNPKIIHRDVKAANVLLDGNFEAVVGDFGLVKKVDIGRNTMTTDIGRNTMTTDIGRNTMTTDIGSNTVTTGLRGTMGHIAPEYIRTGRPSVKTDVYGYGVMLLEIVTGKRAISFVPDRIEEAGEIMLIDQVKLWMEEGRLHDIVDRNLAGVYNLNEVEKIIKIALLCTHMEPDQRPAMSEVVNHFWRPIRSSVIEMDEKESQVEELERMITNGSMEPIRISYSVIEAITKNFCQVIGHGGFGTVYLGALRNDVMVAVKQLQISQDCSDAEFLKEAQCLSRVNHKNIVTYLGYCADTHGVLMEVDGKRRLVEEPKRFLCFEYAPNGTLRHYLEEKTFGYELSTHYKILKGICLGLHYLHQQRITHLDLKPENVLLGVQMEPKITDFGLSRCNDGTQSTIYTTNNLQGTPGYIPPELIDEGKISFKSDIYSLGIIMIRILTGTIKDIPENWCESLNIDCQQMEACIEIAQICVDKDPVKRPTISDIICRLTETETGIQNVSPIIIVEPRNEPNSRLFQIVKRFLASRPETRDDHRVDLRCGHQIM